MKKKKLHEYLKQQTKKIAPEMTRKWLRRENRKRESESLLQAAQNIAIRTNYYQRKN